jgi:hypothetical protein
MMVVVIVVTIVIPVPQIAPDIVPADTIQMPVVVVARRTVVAAAV